MSETQHGMFQKCPNGLCNANIPASATSCPRCGHFMIPAFTPDPPTSPPVCPKPVVPPAAPAHGGYPTLLFAPNIPTGEEMRVARRTVSAEHPLLATPLYQKCPVCHGTRKTKHHAMVDGVPLMGGGLYSGPLPVGSECPMCASPDTPGFIEVGLTVGQMERRSVQRDALLEMLVRMLASNAFTGRGDGEGQSAAERAARNLLAKMPRGEVAMVERNAQAGTFPLTDKFS